MPAGPTFNTRVGPIRDSSPAHSWMWPQIATREPPRGRRAVLGSPSTVKKGLEEVAAAYDASEVMVVTITHSHDARRRSYELIAEAMI